MTVCCRAFVPTLALLLAANANAQPLPLGGELQVNSRTSSFQLVASVAVDAQGGFVVVWGGDDQDGSNAGVFARRFSNAGVALGVELQVNTYTTGSQSDPDVAREDDGDFVVVWRSTDQDGSENGIFARRFNSAALAVGVEFQINTYTSTQQVDPLVAVRSGGGFVVAWGSYNQDGEKFGVFARRFDAAGVPQASELMVNEFTSGDQFPGGLAIDDAGGFVVAWASYQQDGSQYGVFARRFGSLGAPIGGEFQVNTYTPGGQRSPTVAMSGSGQFVVAWPSYGYGPYRIVARRFGADGFPLGPELEIGGGDGEAADPVAGMDDTGDFAVAWSSKGRAGLIDGVVARQLHASGIPISGEFQVNIYTSFNEDNQSRPSLAMTGNGGFVVAWANYGQDGSDYGVFARRFAAVIPLDVDGNGLFEPLTDGLLMLRYGFGFRGATLVDGAVAGNCTRCTAPAIEAYLAGMV